MTILNQPNDITHHPPVAKARNRYPIPGSGGSETGLVLGLIGLSKKNIYSLFDYCQT
jgi:hypothetical protein